MSNHSLVNILLEHVLSISQRRRISPVPPTEHNAYFVRRLPDRVIFRVFNDGEEVFRCIFIPPTDY